jgi:hypothetical protein
VYFAQPDMRPRAYQEAERLVVVAGRYGIDITGPLQLRLPAKDGEELRCRAEQCIRARTKPADSL